MPHRGGRGWWCWWEVRQGSARRRWCGRCELGSGDSLRSCSAVASRCRFPFRSRLSASLCLLVGRATPTSSSLVIGSRWRAGCWSGLARSRRWWPWSKMRTGELAAVWSAPKQGERLWFLGTLAIIRVPGEAVDGRFALIEFLLPRHASPRFTPTRRTRATSSSKGSSRFTPAASASGSTLARPVWSRPVSRTPSGSTATPRACSCSAHRPESSGSSATDPCRRWLRRCRPRKRPDHHRRSSSRSSAATARPTSVHR